MATVSCVQCGVIFESARSTRKWCSKLCNQRSRNGYPTTRQCRHCGADFRVLSRGDANRRYCSKECSKTSNSKRIGEWQKSNPEAMKQYTARWREKNPSYFRGVKAAERLAMLELLGGACVVCGVTNPYWLHVDYIPTCKGLQYRHPRTLNYIRQHLDDFRLLCANHHYELTITGAIEGTPITQ